MLNSPSAVATAANKLTTWETLKIKDSTVRIPDWTTNKEEAKRWAQDTRLLARTTATGSGGAGISVVEAGSELPDNGTSYYVKYVRKSAEYRLHVVDGEVIFIQQKRRRSGVDQTRDQQLIRNHDNGWVFVENDVTFVSDSVKLELCRTAIAAVKALGLDFGACDLIVENNTNNVFFLEVNTRPGLESTKLIGEYVNAFKRIAERQ